MDDLDTYKAQLEQVQAALTTDPDNEDLLKLHKDLEEVINLTLELAAVSLYTVQCVRQGRIAAKMPGASTSILSPTKNRVRQISWT